MTEERSTAQSLKREKIRKTCSPGIEGSRGATSQAAIARTDQAIDKLRDAVLPVEDRLLDGRFVLEVNVGRLKQTDHFMDDRFLRNSVAAAQHPLGFEKHEQTHEHAFAVRFLLPDQPARDSELRIVVANEKPDEYVGVETKHSDQRDKSSTGSRLRPFR